MRGLFFFTFMKNSRKSHKKKTQGKNSQDKIGQEYISRSHMRDLLRYRLISQQIIVTNTPNITLNKSNLSSMAGMTTTARAINPTSDAISDNFSSCFPFSLGKEKCIYAFIVSHGNSMRI